MHPLSGQPVISIWLKWEHKWVDVKCFSMYSLLWRHGQTHSVSSCLVQHGDPKCHSGQKGRGRTFQITSSFILTFERLEKQAQQGGWALCTDLSRLISKLPV